MARTTDGCRSTDASIQAYFEPTPNASFGDGFTAEEVKEALKQNPEEPWHPAGDYVDTEICDLYPGPRAVCFMGRVANIFDVSNTPKTPRSARGCVKLCIKDDTGAITVRLPS